MPTQGISQEDYLRKEEKALAKEIEVAKLQKELAELKRDTEKAQKDLETNELELLKARAAAEAAIASSNKDKVAAERLLYSAPVDMELPKGNITAEGKYIESLVLSQKSLLSSCYAISKLILNDPKFKNKDLTFIFYDKEEVDKLKLFTSFLAELESFESTIEDANKKATNLLDQSSSIFSDDFFNLSGTAIVTAGYAIYGIMQTAAAIVASFKTTATYKNTDLTIEDEFLISVFIQCITKKEAGSTSNATQNIKIYAPGFFPVIKDESESKILRALTGIQEKERETNVIIKKINDRIEELNAQQKKLKPDEKETIGRISDHIKDLQSTIEHLKLMKSAFNEITTTLYKTDEVSKVHTLSALMQSEKTFNIFDSDDTYLILLKTVATGSNRVTSGWWKKTVLEHSAGNNLACLISDIKGEIVFSAAVSKYIPFSEDVEIDD